MNQHEHGRLAPLRNATRLVLAEGADCGRAARDSGGLLVSVALVALAAGVALLAADGITTGFHAAQDLGLALWSEDVWANVTFLGSTPAMVAIVLALSLRFPRLTLALLVAVGIGTVVTHGGKELFDTPRPPAVLAAHELTVIGPVHKRDSMPSGHTMTAFLLAALVIPLVGSRLARGAILLVAAVVGWSRVVCGIHWLPDVLLGASIGLFSGWLGLRIASALPLGVRTYWALSLLLVATTLFLFGYDGGMPQARGTALALGAASVLVWASDWTGAWVGAIAQDGPPVVRTPARGSRPAPVWVRRESELG